MQNDRIKLKILIKIQTIRITTSMIPKNDIIVNNDYIKGENN